MQTTIDALEGLACFEGMRPRLFGIARRVLGNAADADDVVQDAWLRWHRADRSHVRDPVGFLVTMTARLALTAGQSAHARREIATGALPDAARPGADPALDAERAEALELALTALVERLTAAERAAYILREAFDYPHATIADVLGIGEANARQIYTRARRRLAGEARRPAAAGEVRHLLDAFLAATGGDLPALEDALLGRPALAAA
jgi:RNA polymerase sigma-70 factor (ECF subfamily)